MCLQTQALTVSNGIFCVFQCNVVGVFLVFCAKQEVKSEHWMTQEFLVCNLILVVFVVAVVKQKQLCLFRLSWHGFTAGLSGLFRVIVLLCLLLCMPSVLDRAFTGMDLFFN